MIFRYKFTTLCFESEYFYSDLTNCKPRGIFTSVLSSFCKWPSNLEKELLISFHREGKLPITKFQLSFCMIYWSYLCLPMVYVKLVIQNLGEVLFLFRTTSQNSFCRAISLHCVGLKRVILIPCYLLVAVKSDVYYFLLHMKRILFEK